MYKNKKAIELDEEELLMNVDSLLSDDISAGSGGHIDDHQTINRVIKNVSINSVFEAYSGLEYTRVSETEMERFGQKVDMSQVENYILTMLAGEGGHFIIPYIDDGLDTPQTYQDLSSIPVGSTLIVAQIIRGLPIAIREIGGEMKSLNQSLDRAERATNTASAGIMQLVRRDELSERGTNVFEFGIQNREIIGLTEMIPPGTMGYYLLYREFGISSGGPTDLSLLSADPGQSTGEYNKLVVAIDDTDKASVLIEDQYDLTIHKSWDTVPADANAVVIEVSRYDGTWADYREVYAIPGSGPRTDLTDSLGFWRLAAYTKRVDPKIVSLESQVEELDGKVSTLESDTTLSDLEAEVASLTSANSTLQGKVSGLETANSTLESTVSDLGVDVTTLTADKETLEGKVSTLESDNSSLSTTVSTLESDNATLNTTVSQLGENVTTLTNANSTLEGQVSTLESDNASLSETVSGLETDLGSLSSANDTLSSTVSTLEGNVTTLTSDKEALEGQVSTLESTIADLTARLEALENPGGEV